MKLVRTTSTGNTTLAEISNNEVKSLHPSIQRVLDKQKCVVLPAIKAITDQFDGQQRVKKDHEDWAKAVKIYLDFEWVPRAPNDIMWTNDD